MLHILNGDALLHRLERSGVPGVFAVWADALHEGPLPGGVDPAQWREVRAGYLSAADYTTYGEALETLRRWDRGLERSAEHDEVVIWCEHDLFDQLLLIRHLDWFADRRPGGARLSLICIDRHPDVPEFRGLAQLAPDPLAELMDSRTTIGDPQLELGAAAWLAVCAPDPTRIEEVLAGDTAPLPFLGPALRRYLEEFPSVRNGLSRTEDSMLRLLAERPRSPVALFQDLHRREDVFYIADLSFRTVLRRLTGAPAPALELRVEGEGAGTLPDGIARITEFGRALISGAADWVGMNGIDRWLGGVHLQGRDAVWRWDAAGGRLVHRGV